MKRRYVNPFSPDLPIDHPNRFSGRKKEIEEIVDSLFQTANGNSTHTIVTGDRGIGKSSVLTQTKILAEGNLDLPDQLQIDTDGLEFDFVHAWHDCSTDEDPKTLATGITRKLQSAFANILGKVKLELNVAGFLKVGEKDQGPDTLATIVDLFCSEIAKTSQKAIEEGKSGIVLFFDELDRVKPDSGVATFFKLTSERLSREGIKNVSFFAGGITGAVQNLEQEHGSIYRTFKDVPLKKLEEPEVRDILWKGFQEAGASCDESVYKSIFTICAGFPEPVHLLGSQILKTDEDDHLDNDDFRRAKIDVIETLRKNKLATSLRSAGSGKYQKILEAMAKYNGQNVPLAHISELIGFEQNQYSANMGNLVKRDVISVVDRGIYCFVDPLLKEYINHFGVISVDEDQSED